MSVLDHGITDAQVIAAAEAIEHLVHGGDLSELSAEFRHEVAGLLIIVSNYKERVMAMQDGEETTGG